MTAHRKRQLALSCILFFVLQARAEEIVPEQPPSCLPTEAPTPQPALRKQLLELAGNDVKTPLDAQQAKSFHDLIRKGGWPSDKSVGADGVEAAGVLLYRTGADQAIQHACLNVLATSDAISKQAFANLVDRIRISHGEPQVLGTVYEKHGDEVRPVPPVDVLQANALRDKFGLALIGDDVGRIQTALKAGTSLAEATRVPELTRREPVYSDAALRKQLLELEAADQDVRLALAHATGASKTDLDLLHKKRTTVDSASLKSIRGIVAAHGMPTQAMVGRDGVSAMFVLIQHADEDVAFQARCLELMQPLLTRAELSHQEYALLTDRVLINQGKKQLYGTQARVVDGRPILSPVEDQANLDARRASMAMPPEQVYLEILEQQGPPAE